METVLALEAADVLPGRLAVEHRSPELRGGKSDLILDPPSGCVVELKYPRDSRTGFSPDTMTLGELVRDFLRVAAVPADDRWVVQVLGSRLQRYLSGLQHRHGLPWPLRQGETFALEPAVLAALPGTAVNAIGPAALEAVVLGRAEVVEQIDRELTLFAYRVDAVGVVDDRRTSESEGHRSAAPQKTPARLAQVTTAVGGGARAEILDAARRLTIRSGRSTFTVAEMVSEMRDSRYAESTVRTMVTSHLCAQAQGPGVDGHADLDRVGRGVYRLRGQP